VAPATVGDGGTERGGFLELLLAVRGVMKGVSERLMA